MNSIGSGELLISSISGYISNVNSLQAIRVCGTSSTSPAFTVGGKTTAQQIQFYTNGTCFSAFDISGLYIQDTKSISFGTASNNITFTHSGTTSSISFDTLTITPNASATNAISMTSSSITMNKLTVPSISITGTNTITMTGTGSTISSCTAPLVVNGNISLIASMVATLFTTIYNTQTKIAPTATCNSDIGTPVSGAICSGGIPCINNKCGKTDGMTCSAASECIGGYCSGGICYSVPPTNCSVVDYVTETRYCNCEGSIDYRFCYINPGSNGGNTNCTCPNGNGSAYAVDNGCVDECGNW